MREEFVRPHIHIAVGNAGIPFEILLGNTCNSVVSAILTGRMKRQVEIAIDRINEKNNWQMGRVLVPMGSIRVAGPKQDPPEDVTLPSFTGAICAWDGTEDEVVYELVRFLSKKSELWPEFSGGCPLSLARMSRFPGLKEEMVHPGALKYYKKKGVGIGGLVQLPNLGG